MIEPRVIIDIPFLTFCLVASIVLYIEVRKQPKRKSPHQRCREYTDELIKRQGKIIIKD